VALFSCDAHHRCPVRCARIQKLIENIDDTISLIDENGVLIETSGRYKPILGYPSEFWADRTIFDLLHQTRPRVLALREEVVASPVRSSPASSSRVVGRSYQPLEVHAVNLLHDPMSVSSSPREHLGSSYSCATWHSPRLRLPADLRMRLIATVTNCATRSMR
jgi:PAS domain S-box-containing protein